MLDPSPEDRLQALPGVAREAAIIAAWEATCAQARLSPIEPGVRSCSHPDCGDMCIPPRPGFSTQACAACGTRTRHVSVHDFFGVHVLDRCLACDNCD